jgi:hypothetical protein
MLARPYRIYFMCADPRTGGAIRQDMIFLAYSADDALVQFETHVRGTGMARYDKYGMALCQIDPVNMPPPDGSVTLTKAEFSAVQALVRRWAELQKVSIAEAIMLVVGHGLRDQDAPALAKRLEGDTDGRPTA